MKKEKNYLIRHQFNDNSYGIVVEYQFLKESNKYLKFKREDSDFSLLSNNVLWVLKDDIAYIEGKKYWIVDEIEK